MVVTKNTINSINRFYIEYIKTCIDDKLFSKVEMQKQICTTTIANKKVLFLLTYKYDSSVDTGYSISGFYYLKQKRSRNNIEIILNVAKDFSYTCLEDLYYMIKSYLIHEIEHHLQNYSVAFREYLPIKNYETDFEYITSPSELEAFIKAMYYLHRKLHTPFNDLIISQSESVSTNPHYQILFRKNLYNYLRKRKDLNIIKSIN
jgi:hypothetical protein